jgi:hypothetical protein
MSKEKYQFYLNNSLKWVNDQKLSVKETGF